ncbi:MULTISPECIES: hypothetical protein [unclassified Nonomuraea]|uniref:hypothetical protein n=1 Tax=unclassified Nonomuraea TaxID=2593643 RepID=UPI0033E4C0D3
MPDNGKWKLTGFIEALHTLKETQPTWAALGHIRAALDRWADRCAHDPYLGAYREPGFDNLWHTAVPGTLHDGHKICCVYWIWETTRTVKVDMMQPLRLPIASAPLDDGEAEAELA